MKLKTLAIAVLLMPAISAMAQTSGRKWTLNDCINYAISNNITLQKSRLTKQSAQEDVLQAKSSLLPSLSASTNQSVGYRPWINSGMATVSNGTVANKVSKTYYNGSYSVGANWTVWNGNKNRNTVKYNELNAQKAELDSATTANQLKEQIAQLYVQILYMTEAIEVNKQSHATSMKNEERGKEMVSVGKMSKADLAQLTAKTAEEEYNIVNSETQLANYKLQLKQLLEIDGNEDFDVYVPSTTDEQALGQIPSLQSTYETALAQRPEIAASQLAIKSGDVNIAIAKAGKAPTIGLNASVGTSTTSMNSFSWGKQLKTNFDGMAGVSVSIPLFDNRQTKTAVNKAVIQREEAMLTLRDNQKKLYSSIEGYWLDANSNQQKFKAAKASTESEQASYDLLSEQFNLGLKNIVELMTGKTNLLNAQQNRLQSKYMTILNIQMLKFYNGEDINL